MKSKFNYDNPPSPDDMVRKYIEQKNAEFVEESIQTATIYGQLLKDTVDPSVYIEHIRQHYTVLRADVKRILKPGLQKLRGKLALDEAEERHNELKNLLSEATKQKTLAEAALRPVEYLYLFIPVIGCALLYALFSGEITFLSASMQYWARTYREAISLAIGVSTSIFVVSLFGKKKIQQISSKILRKLTYLGFYALILSFILALAQLRVPYITLVKGVHVPIWHFIVGNLVFYLAFDLVVSYCFLSVWGNIQTLFQALARKWRWLKSSRVVNQLQYLMRRNKQVVRYQIGVSLHGMYNGKVFDVLIHGLYRKCVEIYKNTYRQQSGTSPDSFNQGIPPLDSFDFNPNEDPLDE